MSEIICKFTTNMWIGCIRWTFAIISLNLYLFIIHFAYRLVCSVHNALWGIVNAFEWLLLISKMGRLRLFAVQFELNEQTTFSFVCVRSFLWKLSQIEYIEYAKYKPVRLCERKNILWCSLPFTVNASNSTSRPPFTIIDEYIIISNSGDDGSLCISCIMHHVWFTIGWL